MTELMEQFRSPPRLTEALDGSGAYWDWVVMMSDGTTRVRPVSPVALDEHLCTIYVENLRVLACRQALESLTLPQPLAIPQHEIASYQRNLCDDARSGKYSYIPSYMGWHQGEQLELAGLSIPAEWPLSPIPEPSTRPESIEQPAFEEP